MGQNDILMRVENLADTFDSNGEVIKTTIQLKDLCTGLFSLVNGNMAVVVTITEMSMTANQSYEAMTSRKIQWITADDNTKTTPESSDIDTIELQQQRIRVFEVVYTLPTIYQE